MNSFIRSLIPIVMAWGILGCQKAELPPSETAKSSSEKEGSVWQIDQVAVKPSAASPKKVPSKRQPLEHHIKLTEIAEHLSVAHVYDNGAKGELLMFESIGGGVGWIDVQRDGLLDLFCVQGGSIEVTDGSKNAPDGLFVQSPDSQFRIISSEAGISETNYGQGVTIGDFDNDGFDDVYVTNVDRNQLWQNCGDGTFLEVTEAGCSNTSRWSASAAWADVDRDGDLDLYVCNYLQYDPRNPLPCEKDGLPALCHPRQLDAWPDEFFRNNGDGTFQEASKECGLFGEGNKALGVVVTDLNQDGFPDIYVTNDTTANFYFVNQQDGTFVESSLRMGGGLNAAGAMQASMGVAAGDYDRNGMMDLFLTHFSGESNTLYENMGAIGLHDVSGRNRLFPISLPKLGFGTVMTDFDRNGFPDLLIANGHIDSNNADGDGFMQSAQVLTYNGSHWKDVSLETSSDFSVRHVGRGVALGDFDGDGDADVAIANQNEALQIFRNDSKSGNWLTLIPIATKGNRSSIGLKATLTVDGQTWTEVINGGTSFCSSHQHSLFFGVGQTDSQSASLKLDWPGGQSVLMKHVSLNQTLTVREPY